MKNIGNDNQSSKLAMNVSLFSIIGNILLSAIKMLAGIFGKSAALISDSVHSLSDVFSSVIVIIGINISSKEADEKHEYGHERIECLFAIILAVILFITGGLIGYYGIVSLIDGSYLSKPVPKGISLYAALLSIIVKEVMFYVTIGAAKKLNSSALKADAWHHRSDSLSSIGALIGVFLSRHGFPLGEPIASIIICLFIIKAAIDIFLDASHKLIDTSCDAELEKKMLEFTKTINGVKSVDLIKTRQFGTKIYVDIEISADAELTLKESHDIAENVHDGIEKNFENIKHCMVHVNPAE